MAADVLPTRGVVPAVKEHVALLPPLAVDSEAPASEPPPLRGNSRLALGGWVVQKFGGTSVGKVPEVIAEDIVRAHLDTHRVVIVCSARSSDTKLAGTTNRLLRAAREAEKPGSKLAEQFVQDIRNDHLAAAAAYIRSPELRAELEAGVHTECDGLLSFLDAVQRVGEVSARTLDTVISTGEKLACRFEATLLRDRGVDAQYVDLSEAVTVTPTRPDELDQEFYSQLAVALAEAVLACGDRVPVVTGFFGPISGGLLKKIGRGYTDLCAALIAVGLEASELQIWKEVDGIFTANPATVPTARLLPTISPAEAAELTYYGSEVIHPFTMEQVIRARIPIRIRNVLNLRNEGTIIQPDKLRSGASTAPTTTTTTTTTSSRPGTPTPDSTPATPTKALEAIAAAGPRTPVRFGYLRSRSGSLLNSPGTPVPRRPKRPTAVTIKRNIIILNVHSNKRTLSHGFFAGIFSVLDRCKLSVDLISTSEVHVSMALHSEGTWVNGSGSGGTDAEKEIINQSLRSAVEDLQKYGTVYWSDGMAILSLVGRQMRNMMGIAGKMFSVLGDNNVNIEMISQGASEINISCVIEERDADRALNILHTNVFTFLD